MAESISIDSAIFVLFKIGSKEPLIFVKLKIRFEIFWTHTISW